MLRPCSFEACENPAERYGGSCMICARHLCAHHIGSGLHSCPSSERDPKAYYAAYDAAKKRYLAALLARIDVSALEAAASKARNGIPCRIPALSKDISPSAQTELVSRQCGGQNCHVNIEFADGVPWIARLRLDDPLLPPPSVQAHIFLSEVATLQFLENTKVSAPRVYAYELGSPDNPVGTSYVLMEKLPGTPLNWARATTEQRVRIMEQLADVYLELEKHPIPLTGSLIPAPGSANPEEATRVGPFAQPPCFETPDRALGPFQSLESAYTAIIRQQQRMLVNGEVSRLPVDNYLAFLWRLEVLPGLVNKSVSSAGPFFLKHYDDKGDHILVDDEYNITGIIDWEFASAEAKELAFSSPCMMWPVGEFYDGDNTLSEDEERFAAIFSERGRDDLADLVRRGREWQRYLFFLGGGIPRDMVEFEGLFQGMRKSFLSEKQDSDVSSYREWKQAALDGFLKRDPRLGALIRETDMERRSQVCG